MGERASEADLARQSAGYGGGLAFEGRRESGAPSGQLVGGRRSGPGKPPLLTKRWRKRFWRVRELRRSCSRQGASEAGSSSSRTVEKAVAKGRRPRGPSIVRPRQERTAPAPASDDARSVVDPAEAGVRTVKCAAARVVRWSFGSNGRAGRVKARPSPRESNVRAGARVVNCSCRSR